MVRSPGFIIAKAIIFKSKEKKLVKYSNLFIIFA